MSSYKFKKAASFDTVKPYAKTPQQAKSALPEQTTGSPEPAISMFCYGSSYCQGGSMNISVEVDVVDAKGETVRGRSSVCVSLDQAERLANSLLKEITETKNDIAFKANKVARDAKAAELLAAYEAEHGAVTA